MWLENNVKAKKEVSCARGIYLEPLRGKIPELFIYTEEISRTSENLRGKIPELFIYTEEISRTSENLRGKIPELFIYTEEISRTS